MEPLLQHGDIILCLDLPWDTYDRGDIVVFQMDETSENQDILVKQVLGIPGDHITESDGFLYVNGEQSAFYSQAWVEFRDTHLSLQRYYLVGINTAESFDSRYFGPVREDEIMGKYYITLNIRVPFIQRLARQRSNICSKTFKKV